MQRACAALLLALSFAPLPGCARIGAWTPLAPLEHSLAFQPAKYPDGDWRPSDEAIENVWFVAEDETDLHGWFLSHPHPKAVALLCHGNAGNVTRYAETLRILHDRHAVTALVFDYRGYGKSLGTPSEAGILQDARAARKWLAERTGRDERDIVLIGNSLGGGVAVDLAAQDGARGLVLVSTFTSLPAVAQSKFPLLPVRSLMTLQLNSLEKIANYRGPLLLSHGDADALIPVEQGKALYDAAPGPKQLIIVPGGRHNDPQPEEYRIAFEAFLSQLPAEREETSGRQ
jgi:fermentation-respiration switch protein FrsA (DUF1100 family)